ncbi:folic acid synthesis protein-like protein [Patellaria atrata CBS 101060]|uniref:Folic acid synthesis protein FOL1 n=1 Tax=Patellaria atrata CBS 101060 TaxID=1346257 RepID=A0A9P4S530_9PEZI|nr:folic acid synthesis protein-like protein [Patellaria atrata CBS 101060]
MTVGAQWRVEGKVGARQIPQDLKVDTLVQEYEVSSPLEIRTDSAKSLEDLAGRSLPEILSLVPELQHALELNNIECTFLCRKRGDSPIQEIKSSRRFCSNYSNKLYIESLNKRSLHRAIIALGSNVGDRVSWIEQACKMMERDGSMRVTRTSNLWETKAMYVVDQNDFVNGVCEIETVLEPIQLLNKLQRIEDILGRVKIMDKGPRNIDLDIILYDYEHVRHPRLIIPHKLMLEREFVLRPLCDLIPDETYPDPLQFGSFRDHLQRLPSNPDPISTLTNISSSHHPIRALQIDRQTLIMAILNLTPDSFSDGGHHAFNNPDSMRQTILSHISAGAHILDLGGQSTRPNALPVTASEELTRILPTLQLLQTLPEAHSTAISVDTYHSSVASAAVAAGAHIINDISGGTMDTDMLPTVAELGCTVVLMHMRGTPQTMNKHTTYPFGLIETVGAELLERVRAAESAGVRRWRIILDPGIGFAKTAEQNLEILRRMDELRNYPGLEGIPWLVGSSRKNFIGRVTGVKEARDRIWGTAATVTVAVQGGADVVRIHDVGEMVQVVKMADALYRVKKSGS